MKVRSKMSDYKTKIEKLSLPLVALSTTVAFPGEIVTHVLAPTGHSLQLSYSVKPPHQGIYFNKLAYFFLSVNRKT